MRAYQLNLRGECRTIVHPLGLPPSWKKSTLTSEEEAAAIAAFEAEEIHRAHVAHFTPDLRLIGTYPCK